MPTIPEDLTMNSFSTWEENYLLLQEYMEDGEVTGDDAEFWLLTPNPKLNQWLVYNKVEMRKARNEEDPCWMERKQRLADLGIDFALIFRLSDSISHREAQSDIDSEPSAPKHKRSRNGNPLHTRDQEWTGWIRNETVDYFEYIPKMKLYRAKPFKKVHQLWLDPRTIPPQKTSQSLQDQQQKNNARMATRRFALASRQTMQLSTTMAAIAA